MAHRYSSNGRPVSSGAPEWESSFSSILQRTRSNIDRISTRYGHDGVRPASSSLEYDRGRYSEPAPGRSSGMGTGSSIDFAPPSSTSYGRGGYAPEIENYPPPAAGNNHYEKHYEQQVPSTAQLNEIMARLARLEGGEAGGSASSIQASKMAELEIRQRETDASIESIRGLMDGLHNEIKELQRGSSHMNNQMQRLSTSMEILQADVDSRRGVISKLDGWVRQGEVWRADIESQLADIGKQLRSADRLSKEQQEGLYERVTKADLDSHRDKMNINTQQVVNASMSAWHEKVESSVRMVERQVAALRLGGAVTGASGSTPGGFNMSDDELTRALNSQQPSELLIKGVISAEVRELEANIEEKVESRVRAAMRTEVTDAQKVVRVELRDYIGRIAAEAGLVDPGEKANAYLSEQGTSGHNSAAARSMAAKRSAEMELKAFQERLDDLAVAVISLQESQTATETSMRVDMRNIDRKMDDAIAIASSHVASVQERSTAIDTAVRNYEDAQRKRHFELREELLSKQKDISDGWTSERFELDRRILLVEKMVSSALDHVQLSQDSIASYFNSSADLKRLNASAIKVEGIQTELHTLRADAKGCNIALARLEENVARKEEVREIRERVAGVEPLLRRIDDLASTARRVEEESARTKGVLSANDTVIHGLREETKGVSDRINLAEASLFQLRASIASVAEDTKTASSGVTSSVRADMERIKNQNNDLAEDGMKKDRRIKQCEFDLEDTKEALAALQTSVRQLKNSAPAEALHDLQSRVAALQAILDGERGRGADLSQSMNQLRSQIAELQQQQQEMKAAPARRDTTYYPTADVADAEEVKPKADGAAKTGLAARRGTTYFDVDSTSAAAPVSRESPRNKLKPPAIVKGHTRSSNDEDGDDSPSGEENKAWYGVLSPSASPNISPKGASVDRRDTVYFPAADPSPLTEPGTAAKAIVDPKLYDMSDSEESAAHSDGDIEVAHHTSTYDEPALTEVASSQQRRGTEYFEPSNEVSDKDSKSETAKRRGTEYFTTAMDDSEEAEDDVAEFDDDAEDIADENKSDAGSSNSSTSSSAESGAEGEIGDDNSEVEFDEDDDEETSPIERNAELSTIMASADANTSSAASLADISVLSNSKAKRRGTTYFDMSNDSNDEGDDEGSASDGEDVAESTAESSLKPSRRSTEYFPPDEEDGADHIQDIEEIPKAIDATSKAKRRGTEYFDVAADFEDEVEDIPIVSTPVSTDNNDSSAKPKRRGTEYYDVIEDFNDEDESEEKPAEEIAAVSEKPKRRGTEYFDASAEFDDDEPEDDDVKPVPPASKPARRGTEYFDAGGDVDEVGFDDDEPDDEPESEEGADDAKPVPSASKPSRRGTEYFDAGGDVDEVEFDDDEPDDELESEEGADDRVSERIVISAPIGKPTPAPRVEEDVQEFDDEDMKDAVLSGKIDNLMKGFNARDADSSSSSDDDEPVARNALAVGAEMDSHAAVAAAVTVPASAKASEFDEPEFNDDDDLMMAKPSPVYDKSPAKPPTKSHWGSDDDSDGIPDIADIPAMDDDDVMMAEPVPSAKTSTIKVGAGGFSSVQALDESDEFDADDAVANLLQDDKPTALPTSKPLPSRAHSDEDIEDVEEFDADDALSALIKNPPKPVTPTKAGLPATAEEAQARRQAVSRGSKFATADDDDNSVSDWDESGSDSSDDDVPQTTSPVKNTAGAAIATSPHVKEIPQATTAPVVTGRDSVASTSSVTSDPNFLNLSVRERLQLRREALKQSRSSMSNTPTEG